MPSLGSPAELALLAWAQVYKSQEQESWPCPLPAKALGELARAVLELALVVLDAGELAG